MLIVPMVRHKTQVSAHILCVGVFQYINCMSCLPEQNSQPLLECCDERSRAWQFSFLGGWARHFGTLRLLERLALNQRLP